MINNLQKQNSKLKRKLREKDKMITRLALRIGRQDSGFVYVPDKEVVKRITDVYRDW